MTPSGDRPPAGDGPDSGMRFTMGAYNLLSGGIDEGRDGRLRRQLAMLAEAGADAWALQECRGWTGRQYRAFFLAERVLGMRGFLVASAHHGCDLGVFVRESAQLRVCGLRVEQGPPYWHALVCVAVEAPGWAEPLWLVSAHLAPSSPAVRLAEAEALALVTKDGPVIAAGDFNAVPATDPDPPLASPAAGKERRKLDRSAARAIEECGFTDVAAHLGDLRPTVGHASTLAYRCDRAYTTLPAQAITGYEVIWEDEPTSDHRPVVASFGLGLLAQAAAVGGGR